jgi:ethanolamine-phosphate cytidylyltransferase/choline-phosphate cytidylyltransferase
MTRVYVDVVGDLFHYGHVELLRRARELGDVLVVGVHSDGTVESYKRRPIMTMDERVRVVEACRYVDEVVPDAPLRIDEAFIREHRIDLVVHGDDMDAETLAGYYGVAQSLGIFRTVPYTEGISTSVIIERLADRSQPQDR